MGGKATKSDMQQAARSGNTETTQRIGGGTNASLGGHGPMGTTCGASARKLEEETENFKHNRSGADLGKAMMQARTAKGWSQKDLANQINEKPQIIQQTEQGTAVYNPQMITKIERALGVKLPRPNASAGAKAKAKAAK